MQGFGDPGRELDPGFSVSGFHRRPSIHSDVRVQRGVVPGAIAGVQRSVSWTRHRLYQARCRAIAVRWFSIRVEKPDVSRETAQVHALLRLDLST